MPTTFQAIRDNQITLIEALTPSTFATRLYRRFPAEQELDTWADANPAACFRKFDIINSHDSLPPEASNTDVEIREQGLVVAIAYAHDFGAFGEENKLELDDIIEQDKYQIDDTIGLRGYTNYVSSQRKCALSGSVLVRQERTSILVLSYAINYVRTV